MSCSEPNEGAGPVAGVDGLHPSCPLASVLATGQRPSRIQRKGRYVPESMRHPARMLPAIAAQVVAAYTDPGELVVDPMCGIGTTLVEAVHLGRDAAGVEYEEEFAHLAARNIQHARSQGATGRAGVACGDSRHLPAILPRERGRASLVLTSPPYGASTHGHVRSTRDSGRSKIQKWDHRYSEDHGNLAHGALAELFDGFGQILAGCAEVLGPGGVVAVTVRPIRNGGDLVDLPGAVAEAAERAGLVPADRLVALLCGLREGRIVPRASFFQMLEARRAREKGIPACAAAHEDLLIFRTPLSPRAGLDRSAGAERGCLRSALARSPDGDRSDRRSYGPGVRSGPVPPQDAPDVRALYDPPSQSPTGRTRGWAGGAR